MVLERWNFARFAMDLKDDKHSDVFFEEKYDVFFETVPFGRVYLTDLLSPSLPWIIFCMICQAIEMRI